MENVTVILVNYNGKKYLKNCIESIKRQSYQNLSILIVDNASGDESVQYLQDNYPEIEVITCVENNGFAKGNNIGIEYAVKQGADYVLLLNVDTVIEPDLVEKLMASANAATVTVPKIYMDKRLMKVWYAGGEMDYVQGRSYHCNQAAEKENKAIGFACGCCVLIHRDIIKNVGVFDENYYLYFEDTDLSMRWLQHGITIMYIPAAKMWHKVGGSGGADGSLIKSYYMLRNQLYFMKKYQNEMQAKTWKKAFDMLKNGVIKEHNKEKRKYAWWALYDFYKGNMSKLNH